MYLGLDVLYQPATTGKPTTAAKPTTAPTGTAVLRRRFPRRSWRGLVLTRLHVRYTKNDVMNDMVFKEAKPVQGGREWWRMKNGKRTLPTGATPSGRNMFQARYAIRHKWTGKVDCKNPRYGIWGGPPRGQHRPPIRPALNLAFAKRNARLKSFVRSAVPELGLAATAAPAGGGGTTAAPVKIKKVKPKTKKKKKKGCNAGGGDISVLSLLAVALLLAARRRSTT